MTTRSTDNTGGRDQQDTIPSVDEVRREVDYMDLYDFVDPLIRTGRVIFERRDGTRTPLVKVHSAQLAGMVGFNLGSDDPEAPKFIYFTDIKAIVVPVSKTQTPPDGTVNTATVGVESVEASAQVTPETGVVNDTRDRFTDIVA